MIYLYLFGTCFHFIYVFMIIDNIFLKDISCSDENRNEMILQMFVDAIPLIDAFAKTYLRTKGIHHLYSHFNKKYLSKLYDTDNANK